MLIDLFTQRQLFSQEGTAITVLFYFLAAVAALFLRRAGQVLAAKKCGSASMPLGKVLLKDLPSSLFFLAFFLATGCLKGSLRERDKSDSKEANRKIFFGGVSFVLLGFAGSFLSFLLFQILQAALGGTVWNVAFLGARALSVAHLSLFWFSVLPLPASDAEVFLRTKEFGEKGTSFRKDGTLPFFLFCILGLLLACITVPLGNGVSGSLSGILTLFPILLIGG